MPRSRERVFACGVGRFLRSGDEGERADWRAGAVDELERGRNQDRAFRRQLVEIAEARKTVAVRLVDQIVRRERRVHAAGRARVGADRLRSPADDVLREQIFDRLRGRSRRMGTLLVGVEEGRSRLIALVPVGAEHYPAARLDGPMLTLPLFHAVGGEQIVWILRHFL